MIRMGRAATERTRFAFGQVGTMNLPFLAHHEGIGISQRQGLLGQRLDGQLAQRFIYLRISFAQDLDSLLILLLFCCGSIEMSHNLDGLLNILQFPVGYSLAVLQFLYILSGSLISFRLPSLFCGLRRFVQNLFLLGYLFLGRFEGKVRFLRFCFPFLDVSGVFFHVFKGRLILFLRQLQCLFLFFQIRHSRFHFCFQRSCFSDDRQRLFQLFLCLAYCFLQTGESFLAFADGRLLTFDVPFRFQNVFFLLVDTLRLALYFLQLGDGRLYFIVQLQTENLGLHLFNGICCLLHICLVGSNLLYLLIVFLKPLQVFRDGLQLAVEFLLSLFQAVDFLLQLGEFFIVQQVLFYGFHRCCHLVVGIRRLVFRLLDFSSDVRISFLASDEFFQEFVPFVFFRRQEVGKRSLGDEHGAEKLVVVESDDVRQLVPVGSFLCYLFSVSRDFIKRSLGVLVAHSLESDVPFCAVDAAVVGKEGEFAVALFLAPGQDVSAVGRSQTVIFAGIGSSENLDVLVLVSFLPGIARGAVVEGKADSIE